MRLQEGLDALCEGRARSDELERLDEVVETLRLGALCGLCRSAPNPYLSTRRHFPEEYQEHLAGTCRSGSCRDLVRFSVSERCCGCTICAGRCPVSAIKGLPHGPHVVDQGACIKCGTCADVCPFDAVEVTER